VKVAGAGVAALIQADRVEPGELVVITGHQRQVLDDAGLAGHDLDIGGSPLTVQVSRELCALTEAGPLA